MNKPKTENRKPKTALRIFLTGVGGQGTLLASRLLGEAALVAGLNPLVSETHGMAQRGGVVVSTVVLGAQSPLISPGEADVVLGFEALEAFRALDRCHPRTLVIANTAAIVPYPVAVGQAKYPEISEIMALLAGQVGGLLAFDAGALARQAGSPLAVNMVLLGALAATDYLPFPSAGLVDLIRTRTNPKYLEANLQAFQLGQGAARDAANWLKKLKD
ncbi:MAG: pyruvate ferredoxin oxidoreductase [Deltaproteobacteria bacterium]|nr:pyruvate ferredoxin oxidoreductase [Deltaproteobacteria bacterium]